MGVGRSHPNFNWIQKYQLIDQDHNDKTLKLMSRVGEQQYIGKEIKCQGEHQIKKTQALLDTKVMNPSPYLLRLMKVGRNKHTGYCGDNVSFYLVFQKPYQSLKEESLLRTSKNAKFSQEELLCIVQSGVKALAYLRKIEHPHNYVSTSNIFLRQDRTVIVGDPWMISRNQALDIKIDGYTYPSPEKILYSNGLLKSYDPYLSDIFTLGVTILELYFLQHMDVLYQPGFRRILDTRIIQRLQCMKGQALRDKLRIMLSHQPNKRNQIFKQYQKNQPKDSFIKLEKKKFKKNYIQNNLQTSLVETVKVNNRDRDNYSIINGIDADRDRDNSLETLPNHRNNVVQQNLVQNVPLKQPQQQQFLHQIPQQITFNQNMMPSQNMQVPVSLTPKYKVFQGAPPNQFQRPSSYLGPQPYHYPSLTTNHSPAISPQPRFMSPFRSIQSPRNNQASLSPTPRQSGNPTIKFANQNIQINPSRQQAYHTQIGYLGPHMPIQANNIVPAQQQNHFIQQKSSFSSQTNRNNTIAGLYSEEDIRKAEKEKLLEMGRQFQRRVAQAQYQSYKDHLKDKSMISSIVHHSQRSSQEINMFQTKAGPQQTTQAMNKQKSVANIIPEQLAAAETSGNLSSHHGYFTIMQATEDSPQKEEEHSIVYENGAHYKGKLANDLRDGFGLFRFKDGSYYEGQWKQNMMHGRGKLFDSLGGLIYEGGWHMDSFHGHGTLINNQKIQTNQPLDYYNLNDIFEYWSSFEGEFFSDKKHGFGRLFFTNQETFEGYFDNNLTNGKGTFYCMNGDTVKGVWKDNILISGE